MVTAACDAQEAGRTETFVLGNGMQVVVVPDHRAPVVAHMVWYRLGAADEPPGKSGIAHFLEHLMFKGTPKVPAGEFSKIIARNGGRDNAFTSLDYTGYFQTVAVDRLELVMQLESDRMSNLTLTDDVVLPERDVILEERRSRIDNDPRALFSEQFMAAQFLAHPYRIPVIGWAHEIAALTREDAVEFYKIYYAPNNAILVVVGDVEAESVRALAEKYYGAVPSRPIKQTSRTSEPPQLAARKVVMTDPRVREPSWSRTYLAPSYLAGDTQQAPGLEVLADLLGGGSTSRLYRELVVEQKIASGIGAWYQDGNRDMTRFGLYGVPGPGGDIDALEAAVDGVLKRLLADGVSVDEVERSKRNLVASSVYARDGLLSKAQLYGASLAVGLTVEHVETWPQKIREVTVEAVNEAARAVLQKRSSVSGLLLPEPAGNGQDKEP
ncbi:MAG: insulinase family protein [Rhodospirillales bacterium]|nr:insulinase family protein [Rhodospirillales bacterium]